MCEYSLLGRVSLFFISLKSQSFHSTRSRLRYIFIHCAFLLKVHYGEESECERRELVGVAIVGKLQPGITVVMEECGKGRRSKNYGPLNRSRIDLWTWLSRFMNGLRHAIKKISG